MRKHFINIVFVGALVMASFFTANTQSAYASHTPSPKQDWLTGTQIQAILGVLREFGVGPELISKVSYILIRKKIDLH